MWWPTASLTMAFDPVNFSDTSIALGASIRANGAAVLLKFTKILVIERGGVILDTLG